MYTYTCEEGSFLVLQCSRSWRTLCARQIGASDRAAVVVPPPLQIRMTLLCVLLGNVLNLTLSILFKMLT